MKHKAKLNIKYLMSEPYGCRGEDVKDFPKLISPWGGSFLTRGKLYGQFW